MGQSEVEGKSRCPRNKYNMKINIFNYSATSITANKTPEPNIHLILRFTSYMLLLLVV
jgi:hypothetical protein